ncbi:MAG: DUF2442 domain-containing protein [Bryobacterales bacterium]|nr:DUF2442 domain-containing protein [Bryobacterales bacterium]MBV9396458.1 DUF2442 domain-containing protein [Bryobacterales bacterium]
MLRVQRVQPEMGYKLLIEFEDGVSGTLDLSKELYGPVFEPLRDPLLFAQVSIDEYGVICWPNGADLAPEVIHEEFLAATFPETSRRLG